MQNTVLYGAHIGDAHDTSCDWPTAPSLEAHMLLMRSVVLSLALQMRALVRTFLQV